MANVVKSVKDFIGKIDASDILLPFLPLIKPLVIGIIRTYVFGVLRKKGKDELANVLAVELYVPFDTLLEEAAEKTDTPYDDFGVECVMDACENEATEFAFDLPNLDND